jgi:hypothetical protein
MRNRNPYEPPHEGALSGRPIKYRLLFGFGFVLVLVVVWNRFIDSDLTLPAILVGASLALILARLFRCSHGVAGCSALGAAWSLGCAGGVVSVGRNCWPVVLSKSVEDPERAVAAIVILFFYAFAGVLVTWSVAFVSSLVIDFALRVIGLQGPKEGVDRSNRDRSR